MSFGSTTMRVIVVTDVKCIHDVGCTHLSLLSSGTVRVGVLYSNKDYGCEWDYDWRNKRFQREDNTRFAVNIVVYAMTA